MSTHASPFAPRAFLKNALILCICLTAWACKKTDDTRNAPAIEEASPESDATQQAVDNNSGENSAENNANNAPVDTSRIVSLNGAITEILVALDLKDHIVGVDSSSTYPKEIQDIANVGYYRRLSDEGILSLNPTFIIGEDEAGPKSIINRLRRTKVDLTLIHTELTEQGVSQRIQDVADAIQEHDKGEAFLHTFKQQLSDAKSAPGLPRDDDAPSILGVYARGAGLSMVGGKNTAFDVVIELAGAKNAMSELNGFQPLSPEALATSNADILLIPHDGLEALGGIDGVLNLPGVQQTPAGKAKRILTYDDQLLLGLGPRLPEMITTLRADIANAMRDNP